MDRNAGDKYNDISIPAVMVLHSSFVKLLNYTNTNVDIEISTIGLATPEYIQQIENGPIIKLFTVIIPFIIAGYSLSLLFTYLHQQRQSAPAVAAPPQPVAPAVPPPVSSSSSSSTPLTRPNGYREINSNEMTSFSSPSSVNSADELHVHILSSPHSDVEHENINVEQIDVQSSNSSSTPFLPFFSTPSIGQRIHYFAFKTASSIAKPKIILYIHTLVYLIEMFLSFIVLIYAWDEICSNNLHSMIALYFGRAAVGWRITCKQILQ
jgi:hypothetical protein